MTSAPVPVVAVFGGAKDESTLGLAETIGFAIGTTRAILLTGGADPDAPDLKGHVLRGAFQARNKRFQAPWIGVVRSTLAAPPETDTDNLTVVLRPGGDHLRNYVEAAVCDVAIAFPGDIGTISEVAFCLMRKKPVIFMGRQWNSMYPIIPTTLARDELLARAKKRVHPVAHDHPLHLSALIIDAYEQAVPKRLPVFLGPAESSDTSVAREVEDAILLAKARSKVTAIKALRTEENAAFKAFYGAVRNRLRIIRV